MTRLMLLVSSIILSTACTGGGGEGGGGGGGGDRAARATANFTALLEAFCACDSNGAECRASIPEQTSSIACEVDVFEENGQASTIDCIIDELAELANCMDAAACDEAAIELCDQEPDCPSLPEAIEELAQAECGEPDFICGDGSSIPAEWICDREEDCSDGSDEVNCN